MDLGLSKHLCNDVEYFDALSNKGNLEKVIMGNKTHMNIKGVGGICLKVQSGVTQILPNVRYVLKCIDYIISLGELITQRHNLWAIIISVM